jgi:hypothetical protein
MIGMSSNLPDRTNNILFDNKHAHGIGGFYQYEFETDSLIEKIMFGASSLGYLPTNNILDRNNGNFIICNRRGGKYFAGTILNFNLNNRSLTKLIDIDSLVLDQINSIAFLDSNTLLGLGSKDSSNKLFEINLITNQLQVIDSLLFSPDIFRLINYKLTKANNGLFYGVNEEVYQINPRFIYKYNPINRTLNQVYDLTTVDQIDELSAEFTAIGNKLYATYKQRYSGSGVIEFDVVSETIQLYPFNGGTMRISSRSPLTLHSDGNLYGLAIQNYTNTHIFKFDPLATANKFTMLSLLSNYEAEISGKALEANSGKLFLKLTESNFNLFNADSKSSLYEFDPVANSTRQITQSITKPNGSALNNFILIPNLITHLKEQKEEILRIFPNPASSKLTILRPKDNESALIYSIKGDFIVELDQQENTIDVSQYPNGVYFVRLTDEKKSYFKKFVVAK